ncbi:glycosyltransferase [Pseudidiomarina sp. E22-M8]|uniref:glycosyltransferase n=1 Tax=Pseudidiomarina sp. E22-M8 TaxID=3424768 RepID=UPI00403CEBFB
MKNKNLIVFCAPHSILKKHFFITDDSAGSPAPMKVIEYLPVGFDSTHIFLHQEENLERRDQKDLENTYNINIHYVSKYRIVGLVQQIIIYFKLYFDKRDEFFFCYGMGYNSIASYICARLTRNKSILRLYGTFLYEYVCRRDRSIYKNPKRLLEFITLKLRHDKVVVTEDGTGGREVLDYFKIPTDKQFVAYNGLDIVSFRQIPEFYDFVGNSANIFVSVSRLARWKRIDLVLKWFSQLVESGIIECPKLIIIGDGSRLKDYKVEAKLLGIEQHVLFTGGISSDRVNWVLKKSKYFVSFYEAGNVGNTLLEAMRLGCIPIVRDTGLTRQTIKDDVNGFCLPALEERLLDNCGNFARKLAELNLEEIEANVNKFSFENISSWKERMQRELLFIKG